jgi:hypothetical protein
MLFYHHESVVIADEFTRNIIGSIGGSIIHDATGEVSEILIHDGLN